MQKQLSLTARLLCCLIVILAHNSAHSSSIQQIDFAELANGAELIIEAEVVEVQSRWNVSNTQIHTYVKFQLLDLLKGELAEPYITLRFLGGKVAGDELQVQGLVYPRLAERGIYFIETSKRDLVNPLLGWSQGHYTLSQDDRVQTNLGLGVVAQRSRKQLDQTASATRLSTGVAVGLNSLTEEQSASAISVSAFKQKILQSLHD